MKSLLISRLTIITSTILLFTAVSPSTAQTKVACIGNSITSGYQSTGATYVPKLQSLLGSGYTVQNFGVSGTTLLKNGDNPYVKTGQFTQALAFKADIITIKLGTNDTKPYNWGTRTTEFKKDYEWLIDTLSKGTVKPKIFLVLPVPVFYNASTVSWGIRDSIIKLLIPIIKQIGTERNLPVLDANTPLRNHPEYFTVDGIHPNTAAADTIAQVLFRGIKNGVTPILYNNGNNVQPAVQQQQGLSVYRFVQFNNGEHAFANMRERSSNSVTVFSLSGARGVMGGEGGASQVVVVRRR